MNRPVIRRYSNAQMGYPVDEVPQDAAIMAAGEPGSNTEQNAGLEQEANDQLPIAHQWSMRQNETKNHWCGRYTWNIQEAH